jgi:AsmA protein
MAPQNPVPPPPPLAVYRPSFERAPLGSGPRKGPHAPRPPQRRQSGLLLGLVYLFLFVILVAGGGAAYLFINPPSDIFRQKITDEVKAKTGRDLVIAGPANVTLYPAFGISLKGVSLSAPPGMDGRLVEMQALDVSAKLSSLFSRHIEIHSVILRKPVFDFRVDKTGRNNWDFAARTTPVRFAELETLGVRNDGAPIAVAAADSERASAKLRNLGNLQLDDVRIEDGTLRFTDERTGKVQQVSAVNVKLGLDSLQSPLTGTGNLAWRDQRIDFDGKLSNAESLFNHKPAQLIFNAQNPLLTASYDGGILLSDKAYLEGQITAKADSTRAVADWFGTALPPVPGFGPLSIQGLLKTSGNITDFSNAEFVLDGASAKGSIKVTTGGTRPRVSANLDIAELDLNKYLTSAVTGNLATGDEPQEGNPAATTPPPGTGNEPGNGAPAAPDAIEKLLNSSPPPTKVYGAMQRAGWSSERMNLRLLQIADGDAQVHVGKLHFKNVEIGQSSVAIAVENEAMKATFADVQLYQGHGKGELTVDGSAKTLNIAANFNLDGVSALPFLRDAANFEWVAGKTNAALQLTANGASQLQLVESLNGKANFKFTDGAIIGFNLPGTVRGIARGDLSGLKRSPSAKTEFSDLSASFDIANGVAQNHDLQLITPMLKVTGAGTAHMPERTIDYTVKPKIVASLDGEPGEGVLSGIEVPVHITGSWDRPSYQADLKGVLADPNKTIETIKKIGKRFKGKNAGEIVDQLLGKKGNDEGATGTEPSSRAKAKELLNKFLGKDQDAN